MKVSGTITAPAATRTHVEPTADMTVSSNEAPDTDVRISVGTFGNTGNVAQNVKVTFSDPVDCTFVGYTWVQGDARPTTDNIDLPAGTQASLLVTVHTEPVAIGATDQPFSFDLTSVWS